MTATLSNRVVMITGATGALGSVVTRVFAHTEAQLALVSTSAEKLAELADEAGLPEERVFTAAGDLTQPEEVDAVVDAVVDHFGGLDVLLNTVGGWSGGVPVHQTTPGAWRRALDLNLNSAFFLSQAVLPPMLEGGWGRVVHVGSKTALDVKAKQAGYAVAKMGLITLTGVIAAEVKGTGVTANVILPSIIDTPANRKMMSRADPSRWVSPEAIAAAMRFLCSDEAASINGDRLRIYGQV
ncbi:MAG: SDR family NAD(P)-dependent oxidoreductase [Anaerolineae bacterium]|jgi:NAD(P)-dependent dehydrogenase (short-subunit alcohol dehydrogenase family)